MADNKFQVLKKSISSWSLSTIKKPTISAPKFKKPKIKLFSSKKKIKSEEENKYISKEVGENDSYKSDDTTGTVIHEPHNKDKCNNHPYIILTVHDGNVSQNGDQSSAAQTGSEEDFRDYAESSFEGHDKDLPNLSHESNHNIENKDSKVEAKFIGNSIKFIDDDDDSDKTERLDASNHHTSDLGISSEEYYSWFDAEGPPFTLEKQNQDINNEEYSNYIASEYYDASESRTITPSGRSYEDVEILEPSEPKLLGSVKAREWVKSFDEKNIDYEINKKSGCPEAEVKVLPRSRSEVQLNNLDGKRIKNEIILNTNDKGSISSVKNMLSKFLPKSNKAQNVTNLRDSSERITKECEEIKRKESMKKIFGVRGKVSHKTTVIDSNFFKDSDIKMASAPFALTNSVKFSGNTYSVSKDSLDTLEDNLKEYTMPDNSNNDTLPNEHIVDETEELMKEIEKYLSDTDYIGEANINKNIQDCITSGEEVKINKTIDSTLENYQYYNNQNANKTYDKAEILTNDSENKIFDQNSVEDEHFDENEINECGSQNVNENEEDIKQNQWMESQMENNFQENISERINNDHNTIDNSKDTEFGVETIDGNSISDDKVKKAGAYLSNSIKTFKENIFSSENKDLSKLKDEWKKKKSKLNPFRNKMKPKNSENAIQIEQQEVATDLEENLVVDHQKEPSCDVELSVQICSFPEEVKKTLTEVKEYHTEKNNDNVKECSNGVHEVQVHLNFNEVETENIIIKNDKIEIKEEYSDLKERNYLISNDDIRNSNVTDYIDNNSQNDNLSISEYNDSKDGVQNNGIKTTIQTFENELEYNYANFNVKSFNKEAPSISDNENTDDILMNSVHNREMINIPIGKEEENQIVYENEQLNEKEITKNHETHPVYPQTVIKKSEIETSNENLSITKPKPNPRTKKGKYGYSKQNRNSSNLDNLRSVNEEQILTNNEESLPDIIINKENDSNLSENEILDKKKSNMNDKKVTKFDKSFNDDSKIINEPIYWEIGDTLTVPVASPRKKKDKTQKSPASSTSDIRGSTEIPEWIQQRPPIPSPRSKKPKSSQSLVEDLQNESENDIHQLKNVNVFGSSYTNVNFDDPKERNETKWSGEDFYSGKAASISYGITFRSNETPPVLPQRTKKSSLISLPATMPTDEPSPFVRYIKTPAELNKKRIRRKTSPAIPPRGTQQQLKIHLNPLQVLEENLRYFTQIVTSMSESKTNLSKNEELLADVLYSVTSIMGRDLSNSYSVINPNVNIQNTKGVNVTLGQVRSHLIEAFQVSQQQFSEILQEILKREAANVTLTLKVIEATDLRAKTVKGASNPFVTATVPGSNETHRTRTEHETLQPKWVQEFKMKIKNLNKDVLKLEVWHDLDGNVVTQVSAVKDLKSLQRLVKGTTALAQKQESHLLGSVQIPVKDIRENGMNNWFPLLKENLKDEGKERGQLHIEAFVTAAKQGISLSEARRSHDALLAKLIYHHIKAVSNNNTEEVSFHYPWHGQLSPEANAAIAQHAIILGLPPALQHLSWWIVGSRVPSSDAGWQLKYLKIIQSHMSTGLFDTDDLECLTCSFADWTECSFLKLRNLKKSFPTTSGIIAKHQLSSLLQIFIALESHKESSSLLERKDIRDLRSQVREAVTDYMKVWWTRLIEDNLKGEIIPEYQIQKIVIITSEVFNFLTEIATFYSPSLLQEMNIPYFREMFLLITKKLNPCVRPPLINVYNHLENVSDLTFPDEDEKKISTLTLEDGTNLWQLYMNMGRLYKLGADLPMEIQQESGIYDYHKWFNKAVKRWVELAKAKAELMIEKAVKLDDFEPIDEYNNFSSSATDVSGIFTDVQIWWQKLEWPDPENSMILLARILEDICSYGMRYADLLKQKVEVMFSTQSHSDQLVISKQICTGLNNIERIRDELTRLPIKFGVRSLIENVKQSQTGGVDASERFRANIDTLIEISSENMETKVNEFIEAAMEKMTGTLQHAVIQACETSSEKSLFTEILDPALQLLHKKLSDNNFRRFLQRLWEVLIELFHMNVTRNTDKRKASYFNGIYNILIASAKFFSPCEDIGLTKEGTNTSEYVHLLELLECLRLSSENLISRYYNERYEEQKLLNAQSKGELVIRAFFTKAGKLFIEIIMAKDMQLSNEVGSLSSKTSQFGSQIQQVDSFVKIQILPLEWFPNIHEMKTKTLRNSDPAVFEETFEYEMKIDDNGVSSGILLFTVKDYHLGRSNKFIGECVIPLQDLQCIDSSSVHTVPNIYLKITQPGMECGYASLRALRLRTGDKVAAAFLKRIQPRLSDARQRTGCAGLSSDEEKPRARSPRLLQKFGLS